MAQIGEVSAGVRSKRKQKNRRSAFKVYEKADFSSHTEDTDEDTVFFLAEGSPMGDNTETSTAAQDVTLTDDGGPNAAEDSEEADTAIVRKLR